MRQDEFIAKYRWPLVVLTVAVVFVVSVVHFLGPHFLKSAETRLVDRLLEGFSGESAQTRFMSYATKITPLKRIQVAKIEQVEVFDRSSQAQLFWQTLQLPEVVVRATVPVEYTYFVELNEAWVIDARDGQIQVIAPALLPATPSPDVSKLRFEVRKGSLFRNESKVAQDLRGQLTTLLQDRAREGAAVARETARQQVALITQQWLIAETGNSADTKLPTVTVRFADEPEISDTPSTGNNP